MAHDDKEEKLLRSVALQNSQAVLLARERAERELILAKEALERKSSELAEQREFFRVILSSIADGVITTDTEELITFLNPVAESMTEWKSEDAIGQPLEKVFKIINEDTLEPAQNPVTQVLRHGTAARLANHAALVSRNGKRAAIDDSAAPIRDEVGKISGAVMVFHDVAEQRKAQTELRESNLLLTEARDELESRVLERTEELKTANENLRQLSASLQQVRDDEQRRLARELHDSVGQLVLAISMNIRMIQTEAPTLTPSVAMRISENAKLLEQVSSEIRTISHLLHPPLLDEAGLPSALHWYIEEFARRSQIKVELEIPSDFGRLSSDAEIAVFRIVQECLTNIHRHSGSSTATLRIFNEVNHLVIQVRDYGKGISKQKRYELTHGRAGVGFAGMRERLRRLGGTLEIESDTNGTVIIATLEHPSPPIAL